jgi:predicted molibdopterin-dependent oxidoreductase YjgC
MLLRGAVGRPGTGVNPLRGQSNVQGAVDMGCQPDLLTGYGDPGDPVVRARFERVWGCPLPARPGRSLPEMYDAMLAGELKGLFVMGEDVVQTDPHSARVRAALGKLDFLAVQELFMTETARLAHVILPGASWLEKDGTFTNGERRIQRVRAVGEPVWDARPDWKILCELMERTGLAVHFRQPADVMREIVEVAPAYAGVSYDRLETPAGLQWPVPSRDHPGTARLHTWTFGGGAERARLSCVSFVPSPALSGEDGEILLITGRVLEHYNNGAMTRRTDNVELCAEDRFELHPDDARARGIAMGDRVRIQSAQGEVHARALVSERVAPGTAFLSFHFQGTRTNALTSDVRDGVTGCPEYKLTRVHVSRG